MKGESGAGAPAGRGPMWVNAVAVSAVWQPLQVENPKRWRASGAPGPRQTKPGGDCDAPPRSGAPLKVAGTTLVSARIAGAALVSQALSGGALLRLLPGVCLTVSSRSISLAVVPPAMTASR